MAKTTKYLILPLALLFLFGRIVAPLPALAADKITKSAPEFMSTPKEDIAGLFGQEEKTKPTTWITILAGIAVMAALAGGGGGGGGGDSGGGGEDPNTNGSVSVGW